MLYKLLLKIKTPLKKLALSFYLSNHRQIRQYCIKECLFILYVRFSSVMTYCNDFPYMVLQKFLIELEGNFNSSEINF